MFALTFRLLLLGLLVLIVVAVPANDPAGRRDWRAFQAAQGNTLDLLDRQMQSLFAPRESAGDQQLGLRSRLSAISTPPEPSPSFEARLSGSRPSMSRALRAMRLCRKRSEKKPRSGRPPWRRSGRSSSASCYRPASTSPACTSTLGLAICMSTCAHRSIFR